MRLRLDLAYDGTAFSGWARQDRPVGGGHQAEPSPPLRTVQATLEQALQTILRLKQPPTLTVAGRTDAGVHARGQVAHVDVPDEAVATLRPGLVARLAGVLPADVRVWQVSQVPAAFDARFSALARHYTYRLWAGPAGVDPLRRHDVLGVPHPLRIAAMHQAGQALVGEHDFAAFCKKRSASFRGQASTIRRLLQCQVRVAQGETPHPPLLERGLVEVNLSADAFCHSMVRALVGALVVVGLGRRPQQWPAQVLAATVRDSAVQVLPATGLTLERVDYPDDDLLEARAVQTRRYRGGISPTG